MEMFILDTSEKEAVEKLLADLLVDAEKQEEISILEIYLRLQKIYSDQSALAYAKENLLAVKSQRAE